MHLSRSTSKVVLVTAPLPRDRKLIGRVLAVISKITLNHAFIRA